MPAEGVRYPLWRHSVTGPASKLYGVKLYRVRTPSKSQIPPVKRFSKSPANARFFKNLKMEIKITVFKTTQIDEKLYVQIPVAKRKKKHLYEKLFITLF